MINETPKKVLDANLFLKQLSDMQRGSVVDTDPAVVPRGHLWDSPESNLSSQPASTEIETIDKPPLHLWNVPEPDILSLRTKASETRDALTSASEKLENSYLGKYKLPQQYIAPMGAGRFDFESKEQEEAYKDFRDKQLKIKQAIRYLNRAINTPEEKKGSGVKAFQNELHNIFSAGVSGMLENIITATSAKQLAGGEPNEANDALIDAYGQLQQLTRIANKEVPRYRRASSVAGSIPYMEQFLLTGGIGTGAAGVAKTAGQAITKKILNKTIQGGVKRLIEPVIEGAVSMVGRTPLSPATYGNIAESSIGELSQNQQGQYVIDEKTMPSMFEAIGSGTYSSAKEIFTESLGGMVAVPKGILPNVLNRAISPGVKKFFKAAGMNNPLGEYYEEIISNVLGGDKVDKQFLVDLLFTIPVITGGFSVFSAPVVINNMKIRSDRMGIIKTFGKDRVSEIENILDNSNIDNPEAVIDLMTKLSEDFDNKDIGKLFNYAASRVQERAARELQNQQTTDVPLVNTSTGPLTVPTDETAQPEEIAIPQTPEEMDLEVEKHFQPLKENMEQFRNVDDGDIHIYSEPLKATKEDPALYYLVGEIDDDVSSFKPLNIPEGQKQQSVFKAISKMKLEKVQKYEDWVKTTKDNLRMGLQSVQQTTQEDAAKPDPTAENSYKEEVEALAANPEAQPEDIQAIRDRVTDDMVNGVQFSDEFLQQLEITKPEVPTGTLLGMPAEKGAPTKEVIEPKSFPVTIEDKKNVIQTKAIEQPNGSFLLEQTFPAFEEAEKAHVALTKKYGHKGYQVKIESKSTDETNPFAEDIHSVRIITKPVSVVPPEKTVVTKEPVQEGEENERVQAALDKASKPKQGWRMSNLDKERIAVDPVSFETAAIQFFLRGGRISTEDIKRYLGAERYKNGGDAMIWAHSTEGLSLDVISQLPEFEQFMTGMESMDAINTFIAVLREASSIEDMRKQFDKIMANDGSPTPQQTPLEIYQQDQIDTENIASDIEGTILANPEILRIFMEYSDENDNIFFDKLATDMKADPSNFKYFPLQLTDEEFNEILNIITDVEKQRSITDLYKKSSGPQIKSQGDELFPGDEKPQVGTGSQVDQGQPAISETQPTPEVTPPDEEPPAEILPETTKKPEIAGKFPHFPEGTRIMRTDGTGPKKIYYDGLTLGGAFIALRTSDSPGVSFEGATKVEYITPDEFEKQFVKYEKAAPAEVTPEPKVNSDEAIQKARDIVAEISGLEKPESLLNELTLPKEVFGFFNSLRKSDVSRDTWAVLGKGFTPFAGKKINEFFSYVHGAMNGGMGRNQAQDQQILKDKNFDLSLVEKADANRIWFKNGIFLNITTGSGTSDANFFYAGTQVSLRDVPYVEITKMIESGELTEDKANEIIESKQEEQTPSEKVITLLKSKLSSEFDKWSQENDNDTDFEYFLENEIGLTVDDKGIIDINVAVDDKINNLLKDQTVNVYHATSSENLKSISDNGLTIKNEVDVNRQGNPSQGVYVSTTPSGPAMEGYLNNATQQFGGDPIVLKAQIPYNSLQPDPDDTDIRSGAYQFIIPKIEAKNIELPKTKPQFAGDVLKPIEIVDKSVDNLTEKEQQLAQEEAKVDTEPTEAEKAAGNYTKGHISIQGMDISIENPKGSIRKGTDQNGKEWEQEMMSTYGYFTGTEGADTQERPIKRDWRYAPFKKDWIDVFIGTNIESQTVFIIDQVNPETKAFDEHKIILGTENIADATKTYLDNYEDGWQGLGAITGMPIDKFKAWLYDGKAKPKPVAYDPDGNSLLKEEEDQSNIDDAPVSEEDAKEETDLFTEAEGESKKITDFGEKIGGARKDQDNIRTAGLMRKKEASIPKWLKGWNLGELDDGTFKPFKSSDGKGWRQMIYESKTSFPNEEEAVQHIKFIQLASMFKFGGDGKGKFEVYRRTGKRQTHSIKGGFESLEETMKWALQNIDMLLNYKPAFPERPHLDKINRTGPEYRKGNVNTQQFLDTFGFTGGEFGNWVPQDERQNILNMAYDGLMDMANVLGLPAKALSMNGQLSIAFGSRGHGLTGAAAHYERERAVFNLTRINGAGSVAHEWFHAIDHYLGTLDRGKTLEKDERGIVKGDTKRDSAYLSHGYSYKSSARKELIDAFNNVIKTILKQPKIVEVSLKRFEYQLENNTKDVESRLTAIRNYISKERSYGQKKKPATPEQLAKYDELADRIRKFDIGEKAEIETKSKFMGSLPTFEVYKSFNELLTQITGRSYYKYSEGRRIGDVHSIERSVKSIQDANENIAKYTLDNKEERTTPTRFYYDARDIDKMRASSYWSTEHEMAARAFEAFINSKIKEGGNVSQYLVHSTENSFYKAMFDLNPYPEGVEKERIDQAFDDLFKTIETKEEDGNIALMEPITEYLAQKGDFHTVRLTEQVSPEEFQQFKILAQRLGGHWSSYRKEGMLPGFMFKSKENADRFKLYLDNDMVSEPGIVYEDLFGNRTPIQSRMSFDFQPQPETEAKPEKVKPEVKKPVKTRKQAGEFSLVEVKSRIDGGMFFNGSVTVTSPQDVAFLLRNLQTASVENVIIVGIKQDGTPLIYHHSTGSTAGAVIEPTQVARFLHENDFKESYMVHNHPSGNPNPSPSDYKIADVLRKIEESGGKKITFIINDVDTGIFTIFDPLTSTHEEFQELSEKDYIEKGIETKDYEVLQFDRIAFTQDAEFIKPAKGISEERPSGRIVPKIKQSKDVAAFISAMRFSTGEKLGVLVLDRSNAIVANYFIPLEWDSDKMLYELSGMIGRHNGQGVIFYDNNYVKPKGKSSTEIKVSEVYNKADGKSPSRPGHVFSVLDYISAPISPDINITYPEQYISRVDQGFLEPETEYKSKPILDLENRIKDTENRIMETVKQKELKKNELSKRINVQGDMFAGDLLRPKVEQASMFDIKQDASLDNIQRILQPFDNTLARLRDELKGLKNQLNTATKEIQGQGDLFGMVKEPGATMWPEVINGFYSPIEKRLAEFKQERASVNKWKEIIGKGDEAEFTGLRGWLDIQEPSDIMPKAVLMQWMKDNRIEVVEKLLDNRRTVDWSAEKIENNNYNVYAGDQFIVTVGQDENVHSELDAISYGMAEFEDNTETIARTKFSQYQTPGEKSDYKEVLVTLPRKQEPSEYTIKTHPRPEGPDGYAVFDNHGTVRSMVFDTREKANEFINILKRDFPTQYPDSFKSSHFDEPNILVHLRMNTRTDSEGKKVLFIEEIQSDWGQKGKREGFAKPFDPDEAKRKVNEIHEKVANGELTQEEAIPLIESYTKKISTVPPAPFVTDTNAWVKLGFKVAMKEAVAQGVDKISWTTGEQQNDRYDLSKQVDDIIASKNPDGTYNIKARRGGQQVLSEENIPDNKLEDYVGKGLASKILTEVINIYGKTYEGNDLRVGGKGMVGFYGSPSENKPGIIGNIAKSLTKQEPNSIDIQTHTISSIDEPQYTPEGIVPGKRREGYTGQHSIDITPEIKADIQKGLPMFMKSSELTLTEADKEHIDFIKGIIDDLQLRAPGAAKTVVVPKYSDLPDILRRNGESINDIAELTSMIRSTIKWFHALYSPNTDTSYFIAEGTKHDKDYIIEAWLHEQIGHKGIRLLIPDAVERKTFLEGLHDFTGKEAIDKVLENRDYEGISKEREAEEYIAFLTGELIDGKKLTMKERTIWQKILDWFRNAWNKITGKEVSDYDAARVIHAMLTKVMAPAETKAKTVEEAVSLKLYHGTGHDFNSFSTDRVNTGMGQMENGYGINLTDQQSIAKFYANQVASQSIYFKQARADLGENGPLLDKALFYSKGSSEDIVNWLQDKVNTLSDDPKGAKYKAVLQYLETNPLPELRHIYIVSIHNGRMPGDWDYIDLFKTVSTAQINKINAILKAEEGQEINRMTGRMVYKKLTDILGSQKEASEFLLRANIDGLKYESAKIYDETEGTSYIVFDASQVVIDHHIAFMKAKKDDKMINTRTKYLLELFTDRMLSVRELQKRVIKNGGKITDDSNIILHEDRASSAAQAKIENYHRDIFGPLLENISRLLDKNKNTYGKENIAKFDEYLRAKHSPQRNLHMEPETGRAQNADFPTDEANKIVDAYEATLTTEEINTLWEGMNKSTDFTLETQLESGMINIETYKKIKSMGYTFYVPLRAWKDDITELFDYQDSERSGTSYQGLVKAKGRSSESAFVLPFIQSMANTAIIAAEKNKVKQAAYELVWGNKAMKDLFRIMVVYTVDTGDIDAEGKAITYETAIKPAKEIWDEGKVSISKSLSHEIRRPSWMSKQHEVHLFRGGQKVVLVLTDPNVANAINNENQWQPELTRWLQKYPGRLSRWMIANFTAKNPAFMPINQMRDMGYATAAQSIKWGTADQFLGNVPRARSAIIRYTKGKADLKNNAEDILFEKWRTEGGPIGWIYLKEVKDIEKEVVQKLNRVLGRNSKWDKVNQTWLLREGGKLLEALAKRSELLSRYATSLTSLENGRSWIQAVNDGHEITVNFHTKGRIGAALGVLHLFFNATVQGGVNVAKLGYKHKAKFAYVSAGFMALGYLSALLASLWSDDDENGDSYYDALGDWVKHNNLVIPTGGRGFITIPMPFGFRTFFAWGVLGHEWMNGKKSAMDAVLLGTDSVFESVSPVSPSGFYNSKEELTSRPLWPGFALPIYDIAVNEDFAGRRLYQQPFTTEMEKTLASSQQGLEYVSPYIKGVTDYLYKKGGGDMEIKRKLYVDADSVIRKVPDMMDWNPSKIEHFFESYLGGRFQFWNQAVTTSTEIIKGSVKAMQTGELKDIVDGVQLNTVPVLRRLYQQPWAKPYWGKYFEYREEIETYVGLKKAYEGKLNMEKWNIMEGQKNMQEKVQIFEGSNDLIKDLFKMAGAEELTKEARMELLNQRDKLVQELVKKLSAKDSINNIPK